MLSSGREARYHSNNVTSWEREEGYGVRWSEVERGEMWSEGECGAREDVERRGMWSEGGMGMWSDGGCRARGNVEEIKEEEGKEEYK